MKGTELIWEELCVLDPLKRIAAIRKGMKLWTALLQEAVREARKQGVSWDRIAISMGVSRQAVRKRYKVKIAME